LVVAPKASAVSTKLRISEVGLSQSS
jgi:hypothetical protein